jgi:hypothetical protein
VVVADEGVYPHEMIHVGVGYKQGGNGFQDSLGQVVDLATVQHAAFPLRPYPDKKDRGIEKTGEEGWFEITKYFARHF